MRLLVLGKPDCPASLITVANPHGIGSAGGPYVACNNWHKWAVETINRLSPSILVVSQENGYSAPGLKSFTSSQWDSGLVELFKMIHGSQTEKIFLGNIPLLAQSGPTCLSVHLDHARACSTPVVQAYRRFDRTEFSVTESLDIRYIDPTPWFCSSVCTAIVGPYDVYLDRTHVTAAYVAYLQDALAQTLFSPTPMPIRFKTQVSTSVARPSNGATVSGTYVLDAAAALANSPVTKVEFRLSGGGLHNQLIGFGSESFVGWLCYWHTSSVGNGRYTLMTIAYDAAGKSVQSKSISLSVKN